MDSIQIAALVAAAVISFWMLGAYNRLIGLRNAIASAYAQLDEGLARRADAATALLAPLRQTLPNEQGALDALQAAQALLEHAALAMRARPADATSAKQLAATAADFNAAGSRVRALSEQQAAMPADDASAVAQQLLRWREADARIAFARQLFNDAVLAYNEAVFQFPTRLLARVYGLAAAGLI